MKRIALLLIFLVPAIAKAQTTCVNGAPLTLGNGTICQLATDNFNNFNSGPLGSVTVTFNPTATWQSVVFAYICTNKTCTTAPDWTGSTAYSSTAGTGCGVAASCVSPVLNNPCGFTFEATVSGTSNATANEPTWSTTPCQTSANTVTDNTVTWGRVWIQLEDNANTILSCFNWSPSSPTQLQKPFTGNNYLNFALYCNNIPTLSGGKLKSVCFVGNNAANACTAMGLMASAYTGLCTGTSCIDTDGFGSSPNQTSTSLSISTTKATTRTSEMVFYVGGTVNDEALTPSGGCAYISEGNANGLAPKDANIITYKTTGATSAIQTCGQTWVGGDAGGAMIMTVQTAQSGAIGGGVSALSCNYTDVNSVINGPQHIAINGDTIIVPAGSCTWAANQGIVVSGIGISIVGNGGSGQFSNPGQFGASPSCVSGTTLTKTMAAGSLAFFNMSPAPGNATTRISCFNLVPSGTPTNSSQNPFIIAGTCNSGGCPNVRIDNINAPTSWSSGQMLGNAIGTVANMFGVLDHNTIGDVATEANLTFVDTGNGSWKGLGQWGDESWFEADTFGTNQTLYLENNVFNFGEGTDSEAPGSNFGGARIACRFNQWTSIAENGMCTGHGTETTGRPRGTRQWEAYYNTGTCNNAGVSNRGCGSAWPGRSGVGLSFANTFSNGGSPSWVLKGLVTSTAQRVGRQVGVWGTCDGMGPDQDNIPAAPVNSLPWDSTDGTDYFDGLVSAVSGSGSPNATITITTTGGANPNWTLNQWVSGTFIYIMRDNTLHGGVGPISSNSANTLTLGTCGPCLAPAINDSITIRKITACLDQPSRSQGNLMTGNYSSTVPLAYPSLSITPGASGPVNEVIDPTYEAADSLPSTVAGTVTSQAGNLMISGRDWYSEGVGQPAQTSTSSPFNGTVSSQPITAVSCTNGTTNTCTYSVANTAGFVANGYASALGTAVGIAHPTFPTGGYGKITAVVANTSVTLAISGVANDTAGAGGFLTLQGSGHGTLALRPTTCTPSVGYWATDQGTWNKFNSTQVGQLYICTATNTWTLSYIPFTYPHPLTVGVVWNPGPSGRDYVNGGPNGRSYSNGVNGANGRKYP